MSTSFAALGVSTPTVTALAQHGITAPLPIQNRVLPDALAGLDILAASPTGSGKTLAYGIPLVERTAGAGRGLRALVLVPTRELASQVVSDLRAPATAHGLRVGAVYGGTSVVRQAEKARGAQILVATPGRLQDLLDRRLVTLGSVRTLVLDEADRMLDMGFRPQVDKILKHVGANRQTMMFSATLDGAVAELARTYTTNASRFRLEPAAGATPSRVQHEFLPVTAENKLTGSPTSSNTVRVSRSSSCAPSTAPTSSRGSSCATTT